MPQPRAHSALLLCIVAIASLHVASSVANPIGASATASNTGSHAAGAMQPQREYDHSGEAANGPEIVPTPGASLTPHRHTTQTLLEVNKAAKRLLQRGFAPSISEAAVTEAEAADRRFAKPSRRRQLLARLQTAVSILINTTTAASGSQLSSAAARTTDTLGDTGTATTGNINAVADTSTARITRKTAEAVIADTGQKIDSDVLLRLVQQLVTTLKPNSTLDTSTNSTWASHGDLLYDPTLDSSDLGTLKLDPGTLDAADLDSLRSNLGTLDATDPLQGYSDQIGFLQDQMPLSPANATSAAAAALDRLVDAVAAMAGKPGRPRGPVTDWPAVLPGGVGLKPPCVNGLVQQDDRCVCPPGSGMNVNGCVRCPQGWVSIGGPLSEARCIACPELTTSNSANTACVIGVGQPDVNRALCKTCFDPAQPFTPPACCPKGQVCCGTFGCCSTNNCINNATTNNKPFCCEAASPPCPNNPGQPFGLTCCQKGTTCLNTTTPMCCPLGGVCLGSTPANTKCCNPPQASTCAVDRTGLALCCAGPFCLNAGGGNGACCNAGESCIEQRRCCTGVNAQVCRNPATTDPNLAETCCAVDSSTACISSPVNPGLRLCCPTAVSSFVCGNDCCDRDRQQCVNQAECCDNENVCPSPLDPNVEICCDTGFCDPVTKTCQ